MKIGGDVFSAGGGGGGGGIRAAILDASAASATNDQREDAKCGIDCCDAEYKNITFVVFSLRESMQ